MGSGVNVESELGETTECRRPPTILRDVSNLNLTQNPTIMKKISRTSAGPPSVSIVTSFKRKKKMAVRNVNRGARNSSLLAENDENKL